MEASSGRAVASNRLASITKFASMLTTDSRNGASRRVPATGASVISDGRYARLLKNLARADLLILDDWGLAPLTPEQARDLLEIIDDRHGRRSTIVTCQLPVDHWHEVIGNPRRLR